MLARVLRRAAWILYAGLVLVVFSATAYLAFILFVRRGATTVPDVVSLTPPAAAARLRDGGLRLAGERSERYDAEVPAGRILLQRPAAGGLVKRGSTVEVVVSLGPQLVEVPDLSGSALQAAQVTLAAAGLTVGRTISVYHDAATPGTVVDQSPPAGSRAGNAQPVTLYLCQGSPSSVYVMPDLIYRDYHEIRRFFERRGFRLGSIKFETYEGIGAGVVLRQFPLAGHPLSRRDVISLVVASDESLGT